MIGLALSGGGSRAVAFHLGCLRALDDCGLLGRVGVMSTISGGSVIGALYAYSKSSSFAEFDATVTALLRRGLHSRLLCRSLHPTRIAYGVANAASVFCGAVSARVGGPMFRRPCPTRTDTLRDVLEQDLFPGLTMSSPRRRGLRMVIGACDLGLGTAFRFGDTLSGDWRHGRMVDWDVPVSFAVAASAAYPLALTALDRTWRFEKGGTSSTHRVLLTDGGIHDNLGMRVLEPGRDRGVSLHSYPCEYLIVCNAGRGQDSTMRMPLSFFPRIERSFDLVFRRVQESAMTSLHRLRETGQIKGFVLPYLGQQDASLPLRPAGLIPRAEVVGYPTDFAAMDETWIRKLSMRGEQLTRSLVDFYLAGIL